MNKFTIPASLLLVTAFLGITSPARVFADEDSEAMEEACELAGGVFIDEGNDWYGCDMEEGWDVICGEGEAECELGIIVSLEPQIPDEPSPETNLYLAVASVAASILVFGISLISLRMSSKVSLVNLSPSAVLGGGITMLFALIGLALVIFWTAGSLLRLRTALAPGVDIEPRVVFAEPSVFGVYIFPPESIPVTSLPPTSEALGLTTSSTLISPTPTFTFTPHLPTITLTPPTKTPVPPTRTNTVIALGSISGIVWQDENGNGNQDGSEPGYGGVTVKLGQGSCSSADFKSATTSTNGTYDFTGLPSGTYCVSVNIVLLCNEATFPTTATQYEVTLNPGDEKWRSFGYQVYIC